MDPSASAAPVSGVVLRLRLAALALAWEKIWPALVPLLSLLALFLAVALFDVLPLLPAWLHGLVLAVFAGLAGFLIRRLAVCCHSPGSAAAARRLERDSGQSHRPLATLGDRLAAGGDDPLAEALWRLHRSRMAELSGRLRVAWPSPGVPARDPWALRFAALLLLVIAVAGSWADAPRRLANAVSPHLGLSGSGLASLEVWITPPAYTGVAPMLLKVDQGHDTPVVVPQGSTVLAVVNGGWGRARLLIDGHATALAGQGDGSQRIDTAIEAGSVLAVEQGWRKLAAWPIAVARDALPSIAFSAPPEAGERGRLKLTVEASDDYGLAKAWVSVRRIGGPDGEEPLVIDLPLPGGQPRNAAFASWHDLTAHPWAGLPVRMVPVASDATGQVGTGEAITATLPQRVFTNPLAREMVEQRRRLSEQPDSAADIAVWMAGLTEDPAALGDDALTYLALSLAWRELADAGSPPPPAIVAEAQDLMWNIALRLEEGDMASAERGLEEARAALQQALEANASAARVEELLSRFEQALDRYLNALADRMTGETGPPPPGARVIGDDELAEMLDGMRGLAETGNREALKKMLGDLSQLLAELQAAPRGGGSANAEAGKAMEQLRDLARRQQSLMDEAFRQAGPQAVPDAADIPSGEGDDGPSLPGARQEGAGKGMRPGAEAGRAAKAQQALRQSLGEVAKAVERGIGAAPSALGEAGEAMNDAAGRLARGDWAGAAEQQNQALQSMREGARQILQQVEARQGQGRGSAGLPPRDPFGRSLPGTGVGDDSSTRVPDRGEVQRARQILEELRRRVGDWQRPESERDYLRRLLKQF
jgi:uncharacterized protein (TIGR02302 family)